MYAAVQALKRETLHLRKASAQTLSFLSLTFPRTSIQIISALSRTLLTGMARRCGQMRVILGSSRHRGCCPMSILTFQLTMLGHLDSSRVNMDMPFVSAPNSYSTSTYSSRLCRVCWMHQSWRLWRTIIRLVHRGSLYRCLRHWCGFW